MPIEIPQKIVPNILTKKKDASLKKIIDEFVAAIKKEDLKKAGIMLSSILKNRTISPGIKKAASGMYNQLAKKPGYWDNWDIAHTEVSLGLTGCTPKTATGPTIPDEGDKFKDLGHSIAVSTPIPVPKPTTPLTPAPTSSATPSVEISPSPSISPTPVASASPNPTSSPSATPTPAPTLTPSPIVSPTPTAAPTPQVTASPEPIATPDPLQVNNEFASRIQTKIKLALAKARSENVDLPKSQNFLETARSFCFEILPINCDPIYKKNALTLYIDSLSSDNFNYKNSIKEADRLYSEYISKSDAVQAGSTISMAVNGPTYSNIEPLDRSLDSYLIANAKIIEIKNLIEEGDADGAKLASAKAKIKEILGGTYTAEIKKQALNIYCDALSRTAQDYANSITEANRIYTEWQAATGPLFSITIGGTPYSGIGAIIQADDKYIISSAKIAEVNNLFMQQNYEGAKSKVIIILSESHSPKIKKRALRLYCDALDAQNTSASITEVNDIYAAWQSVSQGKTPIDVVTVPVKGTPYNGIEPFYGSVARMSVRAFRTR